MVNLNNYAEQSVSIHIIYTYIHTLYNIIYIIYITFALTEQGLYR